VAYSAEEVIEKRLYDYDLFMLDIMMGEISGFKLAMHLKKLESSANTPIIFLTAKDTETDKLRGFSVGADDYISKPYSINEVIARVKAVLNRTARKNTTAQTTNQKAVMPVWRLKGSCSLSLSQELSIRLFASFAKQVNRYSSSNQK
jgi:DNA-binding response OmpR family regulator